MENSKENFISQIVYDMVANVQHHYDFIDFMDQSARSKVPHALAIKEINQKQQIRGRPNLVENPIRVVRLRNQYVPNESSYIHISVHKQFVMNLCGYHATFNLIQAIKAIKYQVPPQFENVAAFWSYVKRTQDFLKEYRARYRLDKTQWPWKDEDIEEGDFERTYLKVCLQFKPLFKTAFQTEVVNGVKYVVQHDNIFFQYGNVVNDKAERAELQKKFNNFVTFKPTANDCLIQTYMLGATNHWIGFLAVKTLDGAQFIVMDSRARDYFEWNEQQMKEFLEQENARRVVMGRQQWNKFYLDLYLQGMKDIQKLNCLMVSWLTGQSTIEGYVSNQKLLVFLQPLVELLEISEAEFLSLKNLGEKAPEVYQVLQLWLDNYKHTIYEFIGSPVRDVEQLTRLMFCKAYELLRITGQYETNHKLWTQRKQSPIQQGLKAFQLIQNAFDQQK